MDVYGYIESGFDCIVRYCILALEMVGVFVLMGSVLRAIIAIFRKKRICAFSLPKECAFSGIQNGRGTVAHSHCPGVERTLGGGDHHPFPAALTLLIQWEIRIERRNDAERQAKNEKLGESEKNTEERRYCKKRRDWKSAPAFSGRL